MAGHQLTRWPFFLFSVFLHVTYRLLAVKNLWKLIKVIFWVPMYRGKKKQDTYPGVFDTQNLFSWFSLRDEICNYFSLFKKGTSCIWLIFGNISFSNVTCQLQAMFIFSRRFIGNISSEFMNLFIILLKQHE